MSVEAPLPVQQPPMYEPSSDAIQSAPDSLPQSVSQSMSGESVPGNVSLMHNSNAGAESVSTAAANNIVEIPANTTTSAGKSRLNVNAMADPSSRRIIAEDPEWNLAPVEKLCAMCVKTIVKNFEQRPIVKRVPLKFLTQILGHIDVNLPLSVAAPLIDADTYYWERRSREHFKHCDVAAHGGSWKRLYFERKIVDAVEGCKNEAAMEDIRNLIDLGTSVVRKIKLRQLPTLEPWDEKKTKSTDPPPDHFDISVLFSGLKGLEHLELYYGVRDVGMSYSPVIFGMTMPDCLLLTNCLRGARTLMSLTIKASQIDDDKARLIAASLLDNKTIQHINFSHNEIGDSGARAFAKLLATPTIALRTLDLSNNKISKHGGYVLGKALQQNTTLINLSLQLNHLEDAGGASLLRCLPKNNTLESLNLASNGFGLETVTALCALLKRNGRALRSIDVSANLFGIVKENAFIERADPQSVTESASTMTKGSYHVTTQDATGQNIFQAVRSNNYITTLDLRMCGIAADTLTAIQQILNDNAEVSAEQRKA